MNACMHTQPHTHAYLQAQLAVVSVSEFIMEKMRINTTQRLVKMKEGQSEGWGGMKWLVGQLCPTLRHWVIVGSLATPAIFPDGQLFLQFSLLTIRGWMLGLWDFSQSVVSSWSMLKWILTPGGQVSRPHWPDSPGPRVLVEAARVLCLHVHRIISPKHCEMTIQLRDQRCQKCATDDLQERSTLSLCKFGLSKCEKTVWLRRFKSYKTLKNTFVRKKKLQATWKILLTWRVFSRRFQSRSKQ